MNLEKFIENNINGILGTIIFHLVLVIVLLGLKINAIKYKEQVDIVINFEELAPEKEIDPIADHLEKIKTEIAPLSQEQRKNIAVNTANKLLDEISTEKFEKEFKQQHNIKDYTPPDDWHINKNKNTVTDNQTRENANVTKEFAGKTTIEFFLENRWEKNIPIPVYKCQGGGKVKIEIVVNQYGNVQDVKVISATSTSVQQCLIESAIESSKKALFNQDFNAPSAQKGIITYTFIAQ